MTHINLHISIMFPGMLYNVKEWNKSVELLLFNFLVIKILYYLKFLL